MELPVIVNDTCMSRLATLCKSVSLAILLAGCDGGTTVLGEIVDDTGAPVAEAHVEISTDDGTMAYKALSSRNGNFRVSLTHPPYPVPLVLKVEKNGYDSLQVPL